KRARFELGLLTVICKQHRCISYLSTPPRPPAEIVVGRPHDIAAALVLFDYVVAEIRRLTKSRRLRGDQVTDYQFGAATAVGRALEAAQAVARVGASTMAIERVSDTSAIDAFVRSQAQVETMKARKRTVQPNAYGLGIDDGQTICLQPKLEG